MSHRRRKAAVAPAYADADSARLAMVRCDRRDITLTHAGCVRLFVSANGPVAPHAWEGRAACRGCLFGAARAGKPAAVPAAHPVLGMICPRCLRQSTRLIWGRLCASCDARAGEARRGVNSKGGRPGVMDR